MIVDYFHSLLGVQINYGPSQHALSHLMKRSDTDFTVVIPAALDAPDFRMRVHATIKIALTSFQTWLDNSGYKFSLPTAHEYADHRQAYQDVLNADEKGRQFQVTTFVNEPRENFDIFEARPNYENCDLIIMPAATGASHFRNQPTYITQNTSLKFSFGDFIAHFDLLRLKANTVAHLYSASGNRSGCLYTPGELVDVSVGHKDDSMGLSNKRCCAMDYLRIL